MDIDENSCKRQKIKNEKSGDNIINNCDKEVIVKEFIDIYYNCIKNNTINILINNKLIREYSSIKYYTNIIKGMDIIPFLSNFSNTNININKYNFIESGSRRIDITVIGSLKKNTNFNQTFILCHQDNFWFIKNSIFLLI